MKNRIIFKKNYIDLSCLYRYLRARSDDFTPPLDEKVNIYSFAKKIHKWANRYSAHTEKLVGFAGCYANNLETKEAYITNFSVDPNYYGSGLAESLLLFCLEDVTEDGFSKIFLEVHVDNTRAIRFYEKMGFAHLEHETDSMTFLMSKNLLH